MPRSCLGPALLAGLCLAVPGDGVRAQTTVGEIAGATSQQQSRGEGLEASIAVVDVQLLLQKSAAAQSIQRQLDEQRARLQRELAGQEDKIRQSEQELARLRPTLSAEEFDSKRRDFERQVAETRRIIQERTRALETAFSDARETLLKTMMQVVQEVSAERGVTLVVPREYVMVLRDPALDMTESVLRRLDQRLPQVSVALPPTQP